MEQGRSIASGQGYQEKQWTQDWNERPVKGQGRREEITFETALEEKVCQDNTEGVEVPGERRYGVGEQMNMEWYAQTWLLPLWLLMQSSLHRKTISCCTN